jgi:2-polyprenyl-3-methyl-5-hydroxy-6-metoxy-1,4-benzoquinol methylase
MAPKQIKKQQQGPLKRVTLLEANESSLDIYDEWANDYDSDLVAAYGYRAPQLAVDAFVAMCTDRDALIMDFGCGTGLVGVDLASRGFNNVHGLDVSTGMLDVAQKTDSYAHLMVGDLTSTIDVADAAYDALICVGIFGNGHVTADNLPEMLRTAKPKAPIVIYLNDMAYTGLDYSSAFQKLASDGHWNIIGAETSNYMSELERPGWTLVGQNAG